MLYLRFFLFYKEILRRLVRCPCRFPVITNLIVQSIIRHIIYVLSKIFLFTLYRNPEQSCRLSLSIPKVNFNVWKE